METRVVFIYVAVALFISAQGIMTPEEWTVLLRLRQLKCLDETRVNPDLVMELKAGVWKKKPKRAIKEWILCTLVKSGLLTGDGVYKEDNIISKVFAPDKMIDVVRKCMTRKILPAEETAYKFAKCYMHAIPKGNHTLVAII